MTSSTFRLPRSIFLVIIVVMTEIILVIAAAVTLFAADLMEVLPIYVFVFIILFKTAVAIIAALVAARTQPIQPRASISRGAGFLLGHFIGWSAVFWEVASTVGFWQSLKFLLELF